MIRIIIPADVLGIGEHIAYRLLDDAMVVPDILTDFIQEEASAVGIGVIDLVDAVRTKQLADIESVIAAADNHDRTGPIVIVVVIVINIYIFINIIIYINIYIYIGFALGFLWFVLGLLLVITWFFMNLIMTSSA